MRLIALAVVLSLLVLTVWRPAWALVLYAVAAADADGFAVQHLIASSAPEYQLLTRGAYVLLGLWAAFRLRRPDEELDLRGRQMGLLGAALGAWVVVVSVAKGFDLVYALSLLVYTGLPALLVWLAFGRRPGSRKLFFAFVLLQMLISVGTIVSPTMEMVDGATYAGAGEASRGVNLALPTDETLKLAVGRHYGQFHNPNVLGFYAAVALACSFALARYHKPWTKLLAGTFLVLGALGWLNSLTRGVILGLLAAIGLAVLAVWRATDRQQALVRTLIVTVAAAVGTAIVLFVPASLAYLIPDAANASVRYRLSGYDNGFAAITQEPWLGVGPDWDWVQGGIPHFLGLWFAGQYGILGGVLVMLLCFGMGAIIVVRGIRGARSGTVSEGRATLAIGLVLVVWGIAATNNLAAPVLFWVCLAEAMIITTPSRDPQEASGHSRYTRTRASRIPLTLRQ